MSKSIRPPEKPRVVWECDRKNCTVTKYISSDTPMTEPLPDGWLSVVVATSEGEVMKHFCPYCARDLFR